jgi:hypothetical protein
MRNVHCRRHTRSLNALRQQTHSLEGSRTRRVQDKRKGRPSKSGGSQLKRANGAARFGSFIPCVPAVQAIDGYGA